VFGSFTRAVTVSKIKIFFNLLSNQSYFCNVMEKLSGFQMLQTLCYS